MSAVLNHPLAVANEHAVASIVRTSNSHSIIASEDIVDERGQKLWARDQPVTASLQQRLMERKLKRPLEACLRVEDGVTAHSLGQALEAGLASDHPLAQALQRWSAELLKQTYALPLHAAASLLLTVSRQAHPQAFEHAILGMALAGSMALACEKSGYDIRLSMLGGLLHDIGEMYIDPQYLIEQGPLNSKKFKHVLVHPRIGSMLMSELTDYPQELIRGIGDHHERLNGGGYPMHAHTSGISDMGALLAIVETTLGATSRERPHPLRRASLALRAIPGEFDPKYVSLVVDLARGGHVEAPQASTRSLSDRHLRGQALISAMTTGLSKVDELIESAATSAHLRQAMQRLHNLLLNLEVGWNATGLWSPLMSELTADESLEADLLQDEIDYRLGTLQRECVLLAESMGERDAAKLNPLIQRLGVEH